MSAPRFKAALDPCELQPGLNGQTSTLDLPLQRPSPIELQPPLPQRSRKDVATTQEVQRSHGYTPAHPRSKYSSLFSIADLCLQYNHWHPSSLPVCRQPFETPVLPVGISTNTVVHGRSRCSPCTLHSRSSTYVEEKADQSLYTGLIVMYGINSAANALAESTSVMTSKHSLPTGCKLTSTLFAQPTNSKTTRETPNSGHRSRRRSTEGMFGDEKIRGGCGGGMKGEMQFA